MLFVAFLALTSLPNHYDLPRLDLFCLRIELQRFPSHAECTEWVCRADRHLEYIDGHILLFAFDSADWQAYREQVVFWRGIWYDLKTCQTPNLISEDVCRLQRIRATIGEENYAA